MDSPRRVLDLPHGAQTIIDEADYPLVATLTLYVGNHGYASFSRWYDGASHPQTLHSLLLDVPEGMHTDHINGDKLDNRRANLRVVTAQQNQINRHRLNRNNTSGARGVRWIPRLNKWLARIMVNRKQLHIGVYATREQAIAARRAAEVLHYGEECPPCQ